MVWYILSECSFECLQISVFMCSPNTSFWKQVEIEHRLSKYIFSHSKQSCTLWLQSPFLSHTISLYNFTIFKFCTYWKIGNNNILRKSLLGNWDWLLAISYALMPFWDWWPTLCILAIIFRLSIYVAVGRSVKITKYVSVYRFILRNFIIFQEMEKTWLTCTSALERYFWFQKKSFVTSVWYNMIH
jgi:hypothetical protein